jgi:branched-subunit amino acid transport protein
MNFWQTLATILGMAVVTIVTRSFFLIPDHEVPLPGWVRRGLRYAPLAAIAAIVAPEVALDAHGALLHTWRDARLFAALAGSAWFAWRRGILGTIVCGSVVMIALRLGLGW